MKTPLSLCIAALDGDPRAVARLVAASAAGGQVVRLLGAESAESAAETLEKHPEALWVADVYSKAASSLRAAGGRPSRDDCERELKVASQVEDWQVGDADITALAATPYGEIVQHLI
ncbi:MAG: hypothetical protein AAGM22_22810 [Acidobacteriota bacterium]